MSKILIKNAVERRKGVFFFVDKKGNLCEMNAKNAKKHKAPIVALCPPSKGKRK